jgi:hypothetical protein
MNAFIFVSVMCIGQQCAFVTSMDSMPEKTCNELKIAFLLTKFKPEVTVAAAQCMQFINDKVQV